MPGFTYETRHLSMISKYLWLQRTCVYPSLVRALCSLDPAVLLTKCIKTSAQICSRDAAFRKLFLSHCGAWPAYRKLHRVVYHLCTEQVCTFKALLQVGLHIHRILSLAQNLQQIITGKEVEARELLALVLQVVLQALLDVFQLAFHICKALQHTRRCACLQPYTCAHQACMQVNKTSSDKLQDCISRQCSSYTTLSGVVCSDHCCWPEGNGLCVRRARTTIKKLQTMHVCNATGMSNFFAAADLTCQGWLLLCL